MNVNDIRKIIVFCKKNGVKEIEFDNLKLRFGDSEKIIEMRSPQAAIPRVEKKLNNSVKARRDEDVERDEAGLLVLQDPLELERRYSTGELIDETNDNQ